MIDMSRNASGSLVFTSGFYCPLHGCPPLPKNLFLAMILVSAMLGFMAAMIILPSPKK